MRYATYHNFVGRPIRGYDAARCVLTKPAAAALSRVGNAASSMGLSLKVYDCYRPQRAVDEFVSWAKNLTDTLMKAEFYPTLNKSMIIPQYVAVMSGHSRGSTMDLTLVHDPPGPEGVYTPGMPLFPCTNPQGNRFKDNSIDMGTGFDCFDDMANTASPRVSPAQMENRTKLLTAMSREGFVNDPDEWWHL